MRSLRMPKYISTLHIIGEKKQFSPEVRYQRESPAIDGRFLILHMKETANPDPTVVSVVDNECKRPYLVACDLQAMR